MATMYPLFLGVLLTVVCGTVGTGDGIVGERGSGCGVRDAGSIAVAGGCLTNRQAGLPTRARIVDIATNEIGVREATGNNDGPRVEEYLRYTGLGKGHAWCAAFVSWCFGQAGRPQPRNPWSPALFPNSKTYWKREQGLKSKEQGFGRNAGARLPSRAPSNVSRPADLFGIYGTKAKRINHVGLVKSIDNRWRLKNNPPPLGAGGIKYLITIEGNSNNRVESRRRHLSTIYALADWL